MILCDREIEMACEQGRIRFVPDLDPALMDSTAVDLRLGSTLDRWEFTAPDPGLGEKPKRFCPGTPGFKFAEMGKKYTKTVDISREEYDLPSLPPGNFILGWTLERIYHKKTATTPDLPDGEGDRPGEPRPTAQVTSPVLLSP